MLQSNVHLFGIHVGRPQWIAAGLLVVFAVLCLLTPVAWKNRKGPRVWDHSYTPLVPSVVPLPAAVAHLAHNTASRFISPDDSPYAYSMLRSLPYLAFALMLGGAVWWVARRLYDNTGGYISLILFASSPGLLLTTAAGGYELLAALGSFGVVFTCMGIAHAAYAPPEKWPPRVVLLAGLLAFTLATDVLSSILSLVIGLGFALYLAPPGRRLAVLGKLAGSATAATLVHFALVRPLANLLPPHPVDGVATGFQLPMVRLNLEEDALVFAVFTAPLWVAMLYERRARYFGNVAPLLAAIAVVATAPGEGAWGLAAIPFLFVAAGGIGADLIEGRRGHIFRLLIIGGLAARAAFTISLYFWRAPISVYP